MAMRDGLFFEALELRDTPTGIPPIGPPPAPGNTPPTATNDSYMVVHDRVLTITTANGVLANDQDINNDPLTAEQVSNVLHGVLALNANGSFTYTPNAGYTGMDSFTYKASDGYAYSQVATVNISVTNTAPAAMPNSYSVVHDHVLNIDRFMGVLANDFDTDGDALTATVVANVQKGTLTLNSDGSFVYTPNAATTGLDSFTYQVSDGIMTSQTTVSIFVTNAIPTGGSDFYSVGTNGTLNVAAPQGVLNNDYDANNDPMTVTVATAPTKGTLTLNSDGSFIYVPNAGVTGMEIFTYRISDGIGISIEITVTIQIGIPMP